MKLEQIYTGCLAEAAYYIESNGEAAIIDPLRESTPYLERAAKDNAKIKYIFETHFHADFVSGHIDLAAKTGADIVYGPTEMETGFKKIVAENGQIFKIGDITLEVLHTPGHTMESSCYLLRDESGKEVGIFTGDTLFIGDVGRPDLAQKVVKDLTQEKLAGYLYDSLRNKIMPLNDDIIVYPAHGKGSACGKNMSSETTDTLGNQKKTNYALNPELTKEQFIKEVLTGLMPPPAYFPQNVMLNIKGYESLDDVLDKGMKALSPKEFELVANETSAVIIDTRDKDRFREGFVPNSIFIGIDGSFATWVGTLLPDVKQEILIVAEPERVEEVITRLARVGYDNTLGYLKGGFEAWKMDGREYDVVESVSVEELSKIEDATIVDIRKKSEYGAEHVVGAMNAPLDYFNETMKQFTDNDKKYYLHCASGYRSLIYASILQSRGYRNMVDVKGGFKDMQESGLFELTDYVCPSTLL
ncbi:MAG TPA: MBL fold metallo-hydrolase [Saprospiraceae bacterium]|nr:MBL fold metallo-hydrolase [Saprospiraceae bacterium]MCB9328068.1 MBL fold metallo-hydrolase [Lewinellaceae bacterium]HRX28309.1 MBL fold metallo-hydrolase [Saprospiraceae bacterium]